MSDLEGRLRSWFASEVSRAERDLATSRATTARIRHRRPIPGPALAALLVALVVLAVAVRPNVAPDTGKGPVRSPASGPAASADLIAFGPDGMPTLLDGEPVLRVPDAQVRLASAGPTRLLIAGWYSVVGMRCFAAIDPPESPLVPVCNPSRLSVSREEVQKGLTVVPDGVRISVGRVVVRVHTGDARASTCRPVLRDRCEKAVVVDDVVWQNPLPPDPMAGRYHDGIPGDIDGELVMRLTDLAGEGGPPDGSFLLGGWAPGPPWGCGLVEVVLPTAAATPVEPCSLQEGVLADSPSSFGIWTTTGSYDPGPIVVRVHRTPDCSGRLGCALRPALVLEQVLWTGDELTDTAPLTIEEVAAALYAHRDAIDAGDDIGVEAVWIDRTCLRPHPAVIWRATGTNRIGSILVYPTVAAREEAERQPPFASGCNGADVLIYVTPSAAVDNVIVYTQLDKSTTDAEWRALADDIAGWLRKVSR